MAAYDENNVFAKILRGDLPCHRVFEDEDTLAFMDVMPRVEGHVLVIPKRPVRTLLDIAPDDLATLIRQVQRVAAATCRAMQAEGFTLQQFNEAAGGQEVFHLHFHILPRKAGESLRAPGGPMAPPERLAAQAVKIAAALAG